MKLLYTTPTLIFSVIVLLVAIAVSFWSWQRSGFNRKIGMLEALRVLLIGLVLVTLNQPEWTEEIVPDSRPTVAVLYDVSGSMRTEDVVNLANTAEPPKARKDVVSPVLESELWAKVEERMDVVKEPFSSTLPTPTEGTDINDALLKVVESSPNLRGIVLLSDGDWNIGDAPNAAATRLRMKKVPVYSVGVGSETRLPDVELMSLDAPSYGVVNKSMRIPFSIRSSLPRDYDVVVTLESDYEGNDKIEAPKKLTKAIRIPAKGRLQDTIEWVPRGKGEYKLTMEIPLEPSEVLKNNNKRTVPIKIREESLKVLFVESFPRWEYRYTRNALERDPGVEVSCLLFHPTLDKVGGGRNYLKEFPDKFADETDFDVIFLGDVGIGPKQLSVENCEMIRNHVRNSAAGLVFLPGFRGYQSTLLTTKLEELCPVIMDAGQPKGWGSPRPAQFELTEAGRQSLLTRLSADDTENIQIWGTLPGFQWYAAVERAKAGTEVLATHRSERTASGRVPLIATRRSGTGKILFMGTDGAWRWREGVEDLYHYRFWGQVVRWMAYQRNVSAGDGIRLFFSPDRPKVGDVVTLNANVMSDSGEPLQNGKVTVQVTSPSGQTDTVRLLPAGEDSWGLFTGTFEPKEGGDYKLRTVCADANKPPLDTTLPVQGLARERIGQPARYDVMEEIARVSRGEMATIDDIDDVLNKIAELPDPDPVVRRVRIWSHWAWGGLIVLLLCVFWIGRKLAGVV